MSPHESLTYPPGNILILRGDLEILPPDRTTVSYDHLSQLVAEYLLGTSPDVDISAALSIMPYTLSKYPHLARVDLGLIGPSEGMDLNPVFFDAYGFRPQMRKDLDGGEGLELFSHANIPLVHGWLVDPSSPEYEPVQRAGDYDNSVNVVAEADHLTQGRLVVDHEDETSEGSSGGAGGTSHTGKQSDIWTTEQRTKVEDGIFVSSLLCIFPSTHGNLKLSSFASSWVQLNLR